MGESIETILSEMRNASPLHTAQDLCPEFAARIEAAIELDRASRPAGEAVAWLQETTGQALDAARRLVTYTLPEEGGTSLRAAGFRCLGEAGGGSWNVPSRPRVDTHPLQVKLRWELEAE